MCDDREKFIRVIHSFIRHCATTARDDRGLIEDDDDVRDAERDLVAPARATRGRARGGASRKRRGRRLWDIIIFVFGRADLVVERARTPGCDRGDDVFDRARPDDDERRARGWFGDDVRVFR
tara:strand:- start:1327 stop:1692 length:366 start_codon:yes stop_codon:yes gene_type:complete